MTKIIKVTDFIKGKVSYDKFGGQCFWINLPTGGCQMLAEMRGYGAIQQLFKDKEGLVNTQLAGEFQDEIGDWIAEAINEKLLKTK